jgi:hypothetical protein
MTLLFEDAGKPKIRKYQCFVCGKNYESYEDYKNHIVENHDEGREYITCPDCQCPVRDLKLHYKTKHPARIMPKNVQCRVAVWHDFKVGKSGKMEKKSTRKPHFRQGTFTSRKCNCDFEYKSGMECDFFECLEADLDVTSYRYEGMKVPYFFKGKWHNYIPDLRVDFLDGSTEVWEIKPANQTHYEQNKCKWVAADNFCTNLGWQFVVLTEVGLGKLKSKIKRQQANLLNEDKSE